ncbi:transcriptional regulator : DnaK suppressor protein OS=Singulisphaera acidiphila (strain ATCC BAA-1392 / DSM 18658 / VKM B-2454 / MOB10) GN=Sinac_6088 PE=4 SV=1: zf-dskA_traR [Gemmata massiliana]|uniref:Zinc finger DksA/TraR C4-type domain-containing protein n=1 Tax=Gemmata massiliana TaxID=1210884 RepID=A0A6P2D1Z8_9BACT|nr:TraR/DksA family transcriptional regulator [Gemmata massiliana]VTR94877.1 transcriptional regulator : DnaK suppressor protein OS=Singulisphaera acidiphila (strain ATCC BAA-1392 / DSM 18658 / VKM B-2454 / MOB10) GN=Sinac_6088 PE=4 SV=1: zf-dskA_traR [Gemmata massiliana]
MTHTHLSALALRTYRQRLRDLLSRLSDGVPRLEAEGLRAPAGTERVEDMPAHEADRAARETEEDVARALFANEEQILAEATAALERIDAGTFGTCTQCGHAIAKARLDAVPYARMCVRCAREDASSSAP